MLMTDEKQEKQLLTIEQVADILQVSVSTVRTMIKEKQVDGVKVRGQWRIKASSLQQYL